MNSMNHMKLGKIRNMQLKENFKYSLVFLCIYALIEVAVTIVLGLVYGFSNASFHVDSFVTITKAFLLILGLVTYYSTFKEYLFQGVTRKEYVVGSLMGIGILCVFFTLMLSIVYVIVGFIEKQTMDWSDTAALMIATIVIFYAYYVIGWFLGMCFLKYRIIGGTIALIVAVGAIIVMEVTTNIGFMNLVQGIENQKPTSIPLLYNLLSTIIISFLLTFFVYAKSKKIYLRF